MSNLPNFPIALKNLLSFIIDKYPNYKIDTSDEEFIVESRESSFTLLCTLHGDKKIETRWRYISLKEELFTGVCNVCRAEEQRRENGHTRINITKFVATDMREHERHPAKLIDTRFKEFDTIPHREKLLIECLECGWNKDRVSLGNFFSPDKHCDKTYRCQGCVHLGKYNDSAVIKNLKKRFQELNFIFTPKINNGEKIYELNCINCNNKSSYTNIQKLKGVSICKNCQKSALYSLQYEKIAKKGYLMTTPLKDFQGVKLDGKFIVYDFICTAKKHSIQRSLNGFSKTKECKECKREKHQEDSFKRFTQLIEDKRGVVLPNQILNRHTDKLSCNCTYGHPFDISLESVIQGKWCKTCSVGVGERMARMILEHLLDMKGKLPNSRPDFLKNPKTGKNFELDGYNQEMKIAFEYGVEGDFCHREEKQLEYDAMKVKRCREVGVTLLQIAEFENYAQEKKNIQQIISVLNSMNIEIVNQDISIDLKDAYLGTATLQKFHTILEKNNAILLNEYKGLHSQVKIKCNNPTHQVFEKNVLQIIYHNGWCNECKSESRAEVQRVENKKEFSELVHWLESEEILTLDEGENGIENFKDRENTMQFRCKNGHINSNSLLDIRRKKQNNISFCIECNNVTKVLNNQLEKLKKYDNFSHIKEGIIVLKNGWSILINKNSDKNRTILCNGIKTHTIRCKDFNLNSYLKNNYWHCKECQIEELN